MHGTQPGRHPCTTCCQDFRTADNLLSHMKTAHSTEERERFPCSFLGCEKTFLHKRSIWRHCKEKHSENPTHFSCILCEEFNTSRDLSRHIATHTTEKTHKCSTCGKTFAVKSNLKKHQVSFCTIRTIRTNIFVFYQ